MSLKKKNRIFGAIRLANQWKTLFQFQKKNYTEIAFCDCTLFLPPFSLWHYHYQYIKIKTILFMGHYHLLHPFPLLYATVPNCFATIPFWNISKWISLWKVNKYKHTPHFNIKVNIPLPSRFKLRREVLKIYEKCYVHNIFTILSQ